MILHQSAYLDQNLYHAGYPGQMHQDGKIQHREDMNVNTSIWPANWQFGNLELQNYYRLGGVACSPDLASAVHVRQVEIDLLLWVSSVVLATGASNPQAVRVWTGKTVPFGSRPVQKPDPELLGGPNPYSYPWTRGFCRVWLDPSVPLSGSPFRVFLFMVAVISVTVMCKILTLVHHSLYWFYWQPLYSKQGETCSLLNPKVECDQVFIFHHL